MMIFETKAELIEAKATKQHEANLERGGVFDKEGNRFSDISVERKYAETLVKWCGAGYEKLYGLPVHGWYIEGVGVAKN